MRETRYLAVRRRFSNSHFPSHPTQAKTVRLSASTTAVPGLTSKPFRDGLKGTYVNHTGSSDDNTTSGKQRWPANWGKYLVLRCRLTHTPVCLGQGQPGDQIMLNANQGSRRAARIVLCAALSLDFATSASRAESGLRKVCKVGMTLNTLEPDGNAMNCRVLGLQAKVQHYKIGCQSADADEAVMLTTPLDINDETARLTTSSLVANPENAKHAAEELHACMELWFAR